MSTTPTPEYPTIVQDRTTRLNVSLAMSLVTVVDKCPQCSTVNARSLTESVIDGCTMNVTIPVKFRCACNAEWTVPLRLILTARLERP